MEIKLKCNESENHVGVYGSYTEEEMNLFMSVIDDCRLKHENQVRMNLSKFFAIQSTVDYKGFSNATLEVENDGSWRSMSVFEKIYVSKGFFEATLNERFIDFINATPINIKVVDETKRMGSNSQ